MSLNIINIRRNGEALPGEIVLRQDMNTVYGLRNGFGLATIPISSNFKWGGVANLTKLVPTAGRDALTIDSINMVSEIIGSQYCFFHVKLGDIRMHIYPNEDERVIYVAYVGAHLDLK